MFPVPYTALCDAASTQLLTSNFAQTPRWLIKKGRDADAARALSRLTSLPEDDPEVMVELEDIRAALREEQELGESSYLDCFKFTHNKIALRTLSGTFIQAWQQLTGINFIFYCKSMIADSLSPSDVFLARRRHELFPGIRFQEPLPDIHCDRHRECLHDHPRYVGR